jgi:hypothetical protein
MFVAIRLEALAAFALRNDDFHRALGLLGRADALFRPRRWVQAKPPNEPDSACASNISRWSTSACR